MLRRNYDIVATIGTAAVFGALGVPWWLWAAWGLLVVYIAQDRIRARRQARA